MRRNPIRDYRELRVINKVSEEFVRGNHDDRNSEGKLKQNPFWKEEIPLGMLKFDPLPAVEIPLEGNFNFVRKAPRGNFTGFLYAD